MFGRMNGVPCDELLSSQLFDQDTFYNKFENDLKRAKREIIIESPFLSIRRINSLLPLLKQLARYKVRIVVNTKPLEEQEMEYRNKTKECIELLQDSGVMVLFTGGHHRKLAIIDRYILYEGSLNILSQNNSCEVMRRIHSGQLSQQMIDFIGLDRFIN